MRLSREEQFIPIGFAFLDSDYAKVNDLSAFDILVYLHLRRFVRRSFDIPLSDVRELIVKSVVSRIGRDKLSTRLGKSVDTVDRAMDKLVSIGWVQKVQQAQGFALLYVLGDRVMGEEIFFAERLLREFEVPGGVDDEEIPLRTANLPQGGSRMAAAPPPADLRPDPPQGCGSVIEKCEREKCERDTPSELRSEEVPPSSVGPFETPEGLGTDGKPELLHSGAKLPADTISVAEALAANRARGEVIRKGGELTPEDAPSGGHQKPTGRKKARRPPDPSVVDALAEFADAYKKAFGAEFSIGPKPRGQMGLLMKNFGPKERVLAICAYVLERWPDFSRRWRTTGFPDLGTIILRAQSVWSEMQTGKKGTTPTSTRDERTDAQQAARDRMYAEKGGPIVGIEALMGAKPDNAGQGR